MAQTSKVVLALFAGALFSAACSSSGGSDGGSGPTINSFTATPATLPSTGGSVALAWDVTGATSLSIDQGVGPVTPADAGTMSVQVTATTTFTLSATNSSGTSTKTAQVTVAAPITVAGTVVDANAVGTSGQSVVITSGTFRQSAVSDSTGAFSVPNVPTPYTATVIDSGGVFAFVYTGLTRTDPTLMDLEGTGTLTARSAMLAGQVTGGTFPETAGYQTEVLFASPQTVATTSTSTAGAFSLTPTWSGPASTTGTLYALQVHTVSGLPADYPGYGSLASVLLQDMGSLAGQTIPLAAVTPATLTGTITAPSGYTIAGKEVFLAPDSEPVDGVIPFLEDNTAAATLSYTTPSIPNTSLSLLTLVEGTAGATYFKKTGLAANATGVALDVPAPPALSLPVDAATGVTTSTPFTWTDFPGVALVIFQPTGAGPEVLVFTSGSTTTIPDLTSVGLPLPASAGYTWDVYGIGPSTSVDDVADAVPFEVRLLYSDGYFSTTVQRTFTTSP